MTIQTTRAAIAISSITTAIWRLEVDVGILSQGLEKVIKKEAICKMATELSSLITKLRTYHPFGKELKPAALNFIVDYSRFITALENINEMVGLQLVKKQVTHQVQSFVVNYRRFGKPTNGELLHTLVYGPPGCGKTQLGQYLAELWTTSGCLSSEGAATQPNKSKPPTPLDTEKTTLRQNLAIKESQLQQCQERIRNTSTTVNNVLTQFNNVRKKVHARVDNEEQRVQAKFQKIKEDLKEIRGEFYSPGVVTGILKPLESRVDVLPVTVPRIPGVKSIFGNAHPPLLPQIQQTADKLDIFLNQLPSIMQDLGIRTETKKDTTTHSPQAKFIRITRGDLVGKYQGHTTAKVRDLLTQYAGGVVMIDEAYNLCTSGQDDFGKEALTEINNHMTTYPDRIIFIFAGYRKDMEDSVLKHQPGLARRFNWTFEIIEYTPAELNTIFQQQLKKALSAETTMNDQTEKELAKLFEDNKSRFPHYGGDTERFCTSLKDVVNSRNWELALDETVTVSDYNKMFLTITTEHVKQAYSKYLDNSVKQKEEDKKKKDEEESFRKIAHIYT